MIVYSRTPLGESLLHLLRFHAELMVIELVLVGGL